MLDFYVAVHGEAIGLLLYHAGYFIKMATLDIFCFHEVSAMFKTLYQFQFSVSFIYFEIPQPTIL